MCCRREERKRRGDPVEKSDIKLTITDKSNNVFHWIASLPLAMTIATASRSYLYKSKCIPCASGSSLE